MNRQAIKTNITKVLNQIPEITEEKIMNALTDMQNNKILGEDKLVIESIKEGEPKIIKALEIIFNKSIEVGIIPAQWSNAIMVIIHKKGDFEVLAKRLRNKIDFFLSKQQAGFRSD